VPVGHYRLFRSVGVTVRSAVTVESSLVNPGDPWDVLCSHCRPRRIFRCDVGRLPSCRERCYTAPTRSDPCCSTWCDCRTAVDDERLAPCFAPLGADERARHRTGRYGQHSTGGRSQGYVTAKQASLTRHQASNQQRCAVKRGPEVQYHP
jgi:hypothetical protein